MKTEPEKIPLDDLENWMTRKENEERALFSRRPWTDGEELCWRANKAAMAEYKHS